MSTAVSKTAHYWTLPWSRWIQSIYYACFHSIIQYGIIFWGNSTNSVKIFTLQKKIFRIMVDAQPRTSCISLFKQLEILPVPCQYILQLWTSLSIIKKFFKQIHLHTTLTLRWLMSYIYGAPILDVSRSHTTTQHSR